MFDTTPDIMVKLSESLCKYDNYGVCLDYAHAAISKVEPEKWARDLSPYIKHIHINDNDLVSDLHLAWGDGQIDRQTFYKCYTKYMSEATVLIETNSIDNIKKSLTKLKSEGFI
jgi:sugar phosphate isomerase/epimerase